MDIDFEEFQKRLREGGVVGAGGAGFPSYAKLNKNADTILLNCAECEPLLQPHRRLITVHADQILAGLHMVVQVTGARQAIIGVKGTYTEAIEAIKKEVEKYPEIKIHYLQEVYPMGDEVVLIYECTGRVVRPGGLPIEQGCIVYNVETMYNIYRAVENFRDRSYARVRGLVMNRRNIPDEEEKVRGFAAERNLDVVADIPRSDEISRCEDEWMTAVEGAPESDAAQRFRALAELLLADGQDAGLPEAEDGRSEEARLF